MTHEERDNLVKNPNSVVKYFKYSMFRDEFSRYRPAETDNVAVVEDFDLEYIKVLFPEGSNQEAVNAFIRAQREELNVTEVSEEDFLKFYQGSVSCQSAKNSLRLQIRTDKDLEDDLTDQKIVIQNLLFFICDLWKNVLTDNQKGKSKYNAVMTPLAEMVLSDEVQLRANLAGPEIFSKILQDEQKYAELAKPYLEKKFGKSTLAH